MRADAGSSQWLAERRHILRGGHTYSQLPPAGAAAPGRTGSPRWLNVLAGVCVAWTLALALAKYGLPMAWLTAAPATAPAPAPKAAPDGAAGAAAAVSSSSSSSAAAAAAATGSAAAAPLPGAAPVGEVEPASSSRAARSAAERRACLDLVVGEMLHLDPSVSSPRQAALVWLADLVVAEGVRGDFVEGGSKHGGTAVLLFAALMCSGDERRLWTAHDVRDDVREWAATWQARPGLGWRAEQLMRLPAPPVPAEPEGLVASRIALLVCGGAGYDETAACLRRGRPLMRTGGVVLVEEYWKHPPARRAADEALQEAARAGARPAALYAVGEHSRARFGFSKRAGARASGVALTFADVGRHQVLAANLSEAHPLLLRDDKCCNPTTFDAARCCRPHAVLWQAP